jgi:hypothetical protein
LQSAGMAWAGELLALYRQEKYDWPPKKSHKDVSEHWYHPMISVEPINGSLN